MKQQQIIDKVEQEPKIDHRKQRKILAPKKTATIKKRQARRAVKKVAAKRKTKKRVRPRRRPTKGVRRCRPNLKRKGVRKVRLRLRPPLRKKEKVKQTKEITVTRKKANSMEQTTAPKMEENKLSNNKQKDNGLVDPELRPTKTSNVFNIGQYIRKHSKLNVSPAFVHEMISRIKDQIEMDVAAADNIAAAEGMKTLMEKHAIRVYDYKLKETHRIISCNKCGGSFAVDNSHADKETLLGCPYCLKKGSLDLE
jgi:hypothetical protein